MTDHKSPASGSTPVVTTRDTVAAYKLADMRRVFQFIEADDLMALDRLMLAGQAFHFPKGIEVFVLDSRRENEGMVKLRMKGSITEIWASVRAIKVRRGGAARSKLQHAFNCKRSSKKGQGRPLSGGQSMTAASSLLMISHIPMAGSLLRAAPSQNMRSFRYISSAHA